MTRNRHVTVTITALMQPAGGQIATMGFSVDTAAPDGTRVLQVDSAKMQLSATYMVTGLSPGSHMFTAKYKISGGAAVGILNRSIIVTPQ